ncbi:MAG: copper amine oxidase N-terminal domain-containing protein [Defluviitaleaceae bacterium]|nr:copper amine oxidase N-terminal domain-containing protein [Defluviitaleaceae bacterium]
MKRKSFIGRITAGFVVLILMVGIISTFDITIMANQPSGEWHESPQGAGVHIKRDGMFSNVTPRAEMIGFGANLLTYDPQNQRASLQRGDQLVFVGDIDIEMRLIFPTGDFVAFHRSARGDRPGTISPLFTQARGNTGVLEPSLGNTGHSGYEYTSINGGSIFQGHPNVRNISTSAVDWVAIVVGRYFGQEITLGRWQGTNWVETTITAEREAFERGSETLPFSIERTFDGYFILNIPQLWHGSLLEIRTSGNRQVFLGPRSWNNAIIEIDLSVEASAATANILVNGRGFEIPAYNVGGNNFFGWHSMSYILSGTSAHSNLIHFTGGYVLQPNQLSVHQPLVSGTGVLHDVSTISPTSLDTIDAILLQTLEIHGNNFFRLRDLGEILGFNVGWDSTTNTILITTP